MPELERARRPATDGHAPPPQARVWVLDDPRVGTANQAIGIAERLGVPFRRIPLAWNRWTAHIAGLVPGGSLAGLRQPSRSIAAALAGGAAGISLPAASERDGGMAAAGPSLRPDLVISAGRRSGAVALWMKSQFGCRIVHCMSPGLGGLWRHGLFDLLVIPQHDRPAPAPNVFPVLGAPHRVSPLLLSQARAAWQERLAHLPQPRVALLVGGPVRGSDMPPAMANSLGRLVARLAAGRGGAVLATTSRRTGAEATEALSAGLSPALHLIYRWGEPEQNPYHGFLASADAIVVTADSISMISEACASSAAVYIACPELAGPRHRRFAETLYQAGLARPLGNALGRWPRPPLDEAGRVADEIRRRFALD
ncbi:MAG: mitochondrial fission ELM1 family protein [Acetobacteraceae bacterium]|nr:mitochondrial fission ELM1 family protein [Acetobacteraceae bacterium]